MISTVQKHCIVGRSAISSDCAPPLPQLSPLQRTTITATRAPVLAAALCCQCPYMCSSIIGGVWLSGSRGPVSFCLHCGLQQHQPTRDVNALSQLKNSIPFMHTVLIELKNHRRTLSRALRCRSRSINRRSDGFDAKQVRVPAKYPDALLQQQQCDDFV